MALQEETGITTISDEYRQYTAVYGVNAEDPDETLFEVIIDSINDHFELAVFPRWVFRLDYWLVE